MEIYVWGTGRLVGKVIGEIIEENRIRGFIDNNRSKKMFMGKRVFSPEEMVSNAWDAILVITIYSQEIYAQCIELQLNLNKIIFVYNNIITQDINKNYRLARQLLGEKYSEIIKSRYQLIRKNEVIEEVGTVLSSGYTEMDYVRIKIFELISEEIKRKGILGCLAEVGVFRGEFAQYINAAFPERKCYLFDTFEGFIKEEAQNEVEKKHATNAIVEAYRDTNISYVMEKMKYPEKIYIRKGYFPDSLKGLDESFAFVSIDVDFEKSIYESLKYFYPRVCQGGYIFVHDYNSSLKGVKNAVLLYEKENGIELRTVPLCDANGTLIIIK